MNKNLPQLLARLVSGYFPILPISAQGFISVGSQNPPAPPNQERNTHGYANGALWDGENMVLNIWNVAHA